MTRRLRAGRSPSTALTPQQERHPGAEQQHSGRGFRSGRGAAELHHPAIAGPQTAESGEGAREVRRIETDDPVVEGVADINIAREVHKNAPRELKFSAAGPGGAEAGEGARKIRRIETVDPAVVVVGNI